MDVSVVLATHRRPQLLQETLASIARARRPPAGFEVVVCDNAGDPETEAVCRDGGYELELQYLVERTPGKNAALNLAVEEARGDLFLFTDDDVIVDESWIEEMWEGARRWTDHVVFGGRVLPVWPEPLPSYLNNESLHGIFFSRLDPPIPEGPDPAFLPFGPNMAIRRSVFDAGHRYNAEVGPSGRSYIMGSETDMVRRLKDIGQTPVFLPGSSVGHRVRRDQYSLSWLIRRSVNYGRSLGYRATIGQDLHTAEPVPRLLRAVVMGTLRAGWHVARRAPADAFDQASGVAICAGRLYQRMRMGRRHAHGPE